MTTRILKTSTTKRVPSVLLHCPSCRSPQKCKPVGHAVVAGVRREVMQCGAHDCELMWIPTRRSVPAAA